MTERTWTTVGAEYTTPGDDRSIIEHEITRLEWIALGSGSTADLPAAPGLAIKKCISELRIPKVSAIAYNGVLFDRYGLYGIEGNYTNGRARVYVLDRGSDLLPLASELIEEEA